MGGYEPETAIDLLVIPAPFRAWYMDVVGETNRWGPISSVV